MVPPILIHQTVDSDLEKRIGRLAAYFLSNYRIAGPLYRIPTREGETFVFSGVEAIHFFSGQGRNLWSAVDFRKQQTAEYGAKITLVGSDGTAHQRLRKLQAQGYSEEALNRNRSSIEILVKEAVSHFSVGDVIIAHDFFTELYAKALGILFLGSQPHHCLKELSFFLEQAVRGTIMKHNDSSSALESPRYKEAKRLIFEFTDEAIAKRPTNAPSGPRILLDDLLSHADVDDAFSYGDLRAAALGPFIAGLDLLVNISSFAQYVGLREVPTLGSPSSAFQTPHIHRQTITGIFRESLRMYPVAPAIQGTIVEPFAFAGYNVSKDRRIIIATCVSHFLPELFPDPFRIDITRSQFADSSKANGAYAPFGLGVHRCLGASLAEQLVVMCLGLLSNSVRFEIEPLNYVLKIGGTPSPSPLDLRFRVAEMKGGAHKL